MRTILLYIAIGVGFVAGIIALAAYAPHITHAWFLFVGSTVLLAIILAKMYWSVRKSIKVWLLLALFLAVHCTCYVMVLRRVSDIPTFSYIFSIPIEVTVFAALAWLWLKVNPAKVKL